MRWMFCSLIFHDFAYNLGLDPAEHGSVNLLRSLEEDPRKFTLQLGDKELDAAAPPTKIEQGNLTKMMKDGVAYHTFW